MITPELPIGSGACGRGSGQSGWVQDDEVRELLAAADTAVIEAIATDLVLSGRRALDVFGL